MERELARSHALARDGGDQRTRRCRRRCRSRAPKSTTAGSTPPSPSTWRFCGTARSSTIKDYMDPALRARIGSLQPRPARVLRRGRLPRPRGHAHPRLSLVRQGLDGARAAPEPDPPRGALLYNIFNTRTEGHATGWEELMMQAGMFDARPRSRELVYILRRPARRAGARASSACTATR